MKQEVLKHATSWDKVHRDIQTLPTTKKQGDTFEQFCWLFLTESGEYKTVWLQKDIPHTIGKKLKLDKSDHGIDVLVKTKDGRYLGVQCKWRSDETKTLRWSGDKLANMVAHQKLDGYIIFSNANKVDTYTLEQVGEDLITFLYTDLNALEEKNFENYRRLDQKKELKPVKKLKPRLDQKEAIQHVVAGLQKADRGKMILPCGTGKTLTALWIKEKMKPKKTLVLVPSLSLLRQTKEVWRKQKQKVFTYLCVCSEEDIDKNYTDDTPNNTLGEIGFTGLGVYRSGDDIQRQMRKQKKEDVVVFATYQSSNKLKGISFDLVICDEAHKTATKRKSNFAFIHNNKNIPCKKRLYMTATPRVTGNIEEGKGDNDNITTYVADMNNEKDFGKELYRMSFKEAIDKDILCDYKIILMETTETIAKKIEKGSAISETSLYHIYDQTAKEYNIRKAITFHTSIKQAGDFKEKLHNEEVNAYHINGKQNTSERARILKEFEEHKKKSVITNARCLTEGIDVPAIDMVYFCGRRKSKIDIVQIVGRVLRKAQQKKHGYVLIPIVHKKEKQMTKEFKTGEYEGTYREVVSVLRAMQDHDDRLAEEIRLRYLNKTKPNRNDIMQSGSTTIAKEIAIQPKDIHPYILEKSTPSRFLPFKEARTFVHTLGLKSKKEWLEYCKSEEKPDDVPANPDKTYKDEGWIGMGDWLGTGTIANFNKVFRPFKEARTFVHTLGLKGHKEWLEYCKSEEKPDDVPARPGETYKDEGWIGVGDWLGTGTIANFNKVFRPFKEARTFVHTLGLKGQKEWLEYCKSEEKPDDVPANPDKTYKDEGWIGVGDWLGTGTIANFNKVFRPFKEARTFVHTLGLKSQKEWLEYCKSEEKPDDVPAGPGETYKDEGWIGVGDWLGTGTIASRDMVFRPFKEARTFVHTLGLKSQKEWLEYCKSEEKPDDVPARPGETYKDEGWIGMGDWLGTGTIANFNKVFRPFKEARTFVHTLGLKSQKEWLEYCKSEEKPDDVPAGPDKTYKDEGWIGMGDWLGTGTIASRDMVFRPFKEARTFVHTLGLKSQKEWLEYCKSEEKPDDVPAGPDETYKDEGWIGMGDWLGTE